MTPARWARVQEIFGAALEKEPAERRAFVAGASGVDEELRQEVESLLESHEKAASEFLESPAAGALASAIGPRKTLARGTRLGGFEILAALGAGGMGEVYRARDTRLGREVAIKVLPTEVSADPERVKRFQKEARSASALNHPNIVTIHDTGASDGVSWIAMELVEGQTLRQLVSSGPLPVKKLWPIATQIAEGLAKAHESGIVHRDLKPENVMVTKAGLVKILDFGLAKLTGPVSGSGEHSQLPTMSGTSPGIILGTVGYMSPEQASGKPIDYRSDQFAYGSILYEMATGRRAFQKKTAVDTLSAILNSEPEAVGSVNPQTPAPLRWIIERCLAKEPEDRYVSTRDLARELVSVQGYLSEAISGAGEPERSHRISRRSAIAGLGGGFGVLTAALLGQRWWIARNSRPAIPSFRQITFRRGSVLRARFAPDGKTVVYAASWDGAPTEIYTVRTDTNPSRAIGLTNADILSVSSKGELAVLLKTTNLTLPIGTGMLARVSIAGGTPRELLENVTQADWAPNGEDLAVIRRLEGGIHRLEYPIGTKLSEYGSGNTEGYGLWTRVSPDGNSVAYSLDGKLMVVDRAGKQRVVSERPGRALAWSPRGDEIIVNGSPGPNKEALFAVSLSGRERVLLSNSLPFYLHDVAADGRLLLQHSSGRIGLACLVRGSTAERELGWMRGSVARLISPDGSLVIFVEQDDPKGIYLRRTDGTPAVRIGEGSADDLSTDGRWVLSIQSGPSPALVMIPTGSGSTRKIPLEGIEPRGAWLLPNEKGFVVETVPDAKGEPVITVVGPEGGKPRIIDTAGLIHEGNIPSSPEGDRFAYQTKDRRIKIAALDGSGSTLVPGEPLDEKSMLVVWSSDGRFVYLVRSGEIPARIERVELSTGRRAPWKTVMPGDPSGITEIATVILAPDGLSHAYSYYRSLVSDLYIGEGVL